MKHGLMALFHEVPFEGVNGSGKHNNWSFGTNEIPSLLIPGKEPLKNNYFLFFLACIVRAVDLHSDLIRIGISGASNDHRLGGNEAPPAIISVDVGDEVEKCIEQFVEGTEKSDDSEIKVDLGIPYFPKVEKDKSDRNRSAPIALAGAKFEVRALGASHNACRLNTILNTIFAESIRDLTDKIEEELKGSDKSDKKEEALRKVARDALKYHRRVIYNGDCYSDEWKKEAKKRGLLNLETTPQALAEFDKEKNLKMFSKLKILSEDEIKARRQVYEEDYYKKIMIEAKTLRQMTSTQILPAALRYATEVGKATEILKDSKECVRIMKILTSTIDLTSQGLEALDILLGKQIYTDQDKTKGVDHKELKGSAQQAKFAETKLLPAMKKLRESLEKLEGIVAADQWPLPTYFQMLYDQD
eukprot:TRINITY_DN4380_c0_g1_i32.p1 TRINITY_DN4380_c0_g1~~TRINITY_DN4380_c0_g1_i32.p1  ORF type:complete len:488 (+),score=100.44 TRINITY_DN4380_c0_g1_i32:221-1465(+)